MRLIVRDYIAAAIDRARPELEQFITEHMECRCGKPARVRCRLNARLNVFVRQANRSSKAREPATRGSGRAV